MARARAVLRGAFTNAVARRLIDWDPWTAVEPEAGDEPHLVDPDLAMTHDQITALAAAAIFPTGPLRQVRRQDLRHAAITLWLNSGVPLKVAQTWSGHKTLSVLLDTHYGSCNTTNTSPTNASKTPSTYDPRRQAWHTHGRSPTE